MVHSNEINSQSFIGLQLMPAVAEPHLNAPPTFGARALGRRAFTSPPLADLHLRLP
jgi:hypothetical protein